MRVTSAGRMRPHVKAPVDDAAMATIRKVCPGITLKGPDPAQLEGEGMMHPVWGPLLTLHRGWSGDPAMRRHAAAGGALTALGSYLLDSGKVEAIVHVRASAERPMETDAVVSTTREEVVAGAQSRYGPAAPLVHVHRLLDEGRRFAVIAKPCDIGAIRSLQRVDRRAADLIAYGLTIFCGGAANLKCAEDITRHHGVEPKDVTMFRWRGDGWPGPTRVTTRQGGIHDITYDQAWFTPDTPWSYDMQFRCKICPDAIGELADVACPDGWVMRDGRPIHEEDDGVNIVIARTPSGAALVAEAAAAGALELAPFGAEELDLMHRDHLPRKIENPARLRGLSLEGEPVPDFADFRADQMVLMAGPERDARACEATRKRIREGRNREPFA